MKSRFVLFAALFLSMLFPVAVSAQETLDALVERELPVLVEHYQMLHAAPELSGQEEKTSAFVARELRALGFDVTERFGKYADPKMTAYGGVGVLCNGAGPTVLVRADMDALPIEEKTGLPYASRVKAINFDGKETFVMHACGHDLHITIFLGVAKALVQFKDQWRGTLLMIGQPAEETVGGAESMIHAGLYDRFPKPDYALALHDWSTIEAGKVGYCPGFAMASVTTVEVVMRGLGGHGSAPETTKDPIVASAQCIMMLQTIVSREIPARDSAVVTVGAIHGGTRSNIIPEEVRMQLTVRTYDEEVRQKITASIERIAKHAALAAGIPEDRAPIVTVSKETPPLFNDPELTRCVADAMKKALGEDNVLQQPPVMGSEDFSVFGLKDRRVPVCLFWVGAVDPEKYAESQRTGDRLPALHSPHFAPAAEPTIRTGVKAMPSSVLELMKK